MPGEEARFVAPLVDLQTWIDRRPIWVVASLAPFAVFLFPPEARAEIHGYVVFAVWMLVLSALALRAWVHAQTRGRVLVLASKKSIFVGPFSFPLATLRRAYATRSLADGTWRLTLEAKTSSTAELTVSEAELGDLETATGLDVRHTPIPILFHTNSLVSTIASERRRSAIWFLGIAYVFTNVILRRLGIPNGAAHASGEALVYILALVFRDLWDGPWRVDVLAGIDGLALRRLEWNGHFVPYADVAPVKTDDRKVILRGAKPLTAYAGADDVDRVADTIEMLRAAAPTDASLPALRADESDGRTWLARLRGILVNAGQSFRDVPISPETLWKVVEHGRSEEERLGAAVALLESGEDVRTKLRVFADESADLVLARKLRAVAESEDDATLEALLERERSEDQRGG